MCESSQQRSGWWARRAIALLLPLPGRLRRNLDAATAPRRSERRVFMEAVPIYGWLLGRSKYPTVRLTFILVAVFAAIALTCYYEGCLYLPGRNVGFVDDPVMYTLLALQLMMVFFVQRLFDKVGDLLDCSADGDGLGRVLSAEGRKRVCLESERRRILEFIGLRTPEARDWFWMLFCLWVLITILFQVVVPLAWPQPVRAWAIWPSRFPLSFAAGCAWAFLVYSVILCCSTWYLFSVGMVVFSFVYRLVRQGWLEVLPLSPDNRGGLSCLGRTSFALSLVAMPGMLLVVAWIVVYGVDLPTKIGLPLYTVIIVAVFFGPLMSVHRAMKDAKQRELKRLAAAYHVRHREFVHSLSIPQDAVSAGQTGTLLEELSQIEQLYQRAEAMPVWPFDAATLRQFFTLIVVPVLALLIQWFGENALTKWFAGWFT